MQLSEVRSSLPRFSIPIEVARNFMAVKEKRETVGPMNPCAMILELKRWLETVLPGSGNRIIRLNHLHPDQNLSAETFNREFGESGLPADLLPGEKELGKILQICSRLPYTEKKIGVVSLGFEYETEKLKSSFSFPYGEDMPEIHFHFLDKVELSGFPRGVLRNVKMDIGCLSNGDIPYTYIDLLIKPDKREFKKRWLLGDVKIRQEKMIEFFKVSE